MVEAGNAFHSAGQHAMDCEQLMLVRFESFSVKRVSYRSGVFEIDQPGRRGLG